MNVAVHGELLPPMDAAAGAFYRTTLALASGPSPDTRVVPGGPSKIGIRYSMGNASISPKESHAFPWFDGGTQQSSRAAHPSWTNTTVT